MHWMCGSFRKAPALWAQALSSNPSPLPPKENIATHNNKDDKGYRTFSYKINKFNMVTIVDNASYI
jgi:hypothetical protein